MTNIDITIFTVLTSFQDNLISYVQNPFVSTLIPSIRFIVSLYRDTYIQSHPLKSKLWAELYKSGMTAFMHTRAAMYFFRNRTYDYLINGIQCIRLSATSLIHDSKSTKPINDSNSQLVSFNQFSLYYNRSKKFISLIFFAYGQHAPFPWKI